MYGAVFFFNIYFPLLIKKKKKEKNANAYKYCVANNKIKSFLFYSDNPNLEHFGCTE